MAKYNFKIVRTEVEEVTLPMEANNPGAATALAAALQMNPSVIEQVGGGKWKPSGAAPMTYVVTVV